jgi:uncharacterized damage-inducible protein DinB
MITDTLKKLITRDLIKLKQEIEAYSCEEKLWYTEKDVSNSAGNLCLHLVGNLEWYIGAELGGTGYVRNRADEFGLKNVARAELIDKIEKAIATVKATFTILSDSQMDEIYPGETNEKNSTTGYILMHLAIHLGYHLGQINYHRRLLDN